MQDACADKPSKKHCSARQRNNCLIVLAVVEDFVIDHYDQSELKQEGQDDVNENV